MIYGSKKLGILSEINNGHKTHKHILSNCVKEKHQCCKNLGNFFGFLAKTTKNSEFVLLAFKASEASIEKVAKLC